MHEVKLRTGVWYNDREISLTFPDSWDVVTHWPDTPLPLTANDIIEKLNSPIGQPPLRDLAKGKKEPVIVVDDLARPTPVFKIMPFLLNEFAAAGVSLDKIRILVATGTHGDQDRNALVNKIGKETAESCQVIVHDDMKNIRYIGKTSFGTTVYVNKEIVKSDFVIGVGGVYPQYTTGFGGGSKLALGILGRRSIKQLHFKHKGVGGTYNVDNDFRRDLTEIAHLIGMNTMYILHINAHMEVVNLMCGDHFTYYPKAVEFSKKRYTAPLPDDADVVIANCYPSDISYTFMGKGMKTIRCSPQRATKIVIASNTEGIGKHGLFPHGISQLLRKIKFLYYKISVTEPKVIISKTIEKLLRRKKGVIARKAVRPSQEEKKENLWLYRPKGNAGPIQAMPGMRIVESWDEVLRVIEREHSSKKNVRVRIYPCSSLQCLDARQAGVESITA